MPSRPLLPGTALRAAFLSLHSAFQPGWSHPQSGAAVGRSHQAHLVSPCSPRPQDFHAGEFVASDYEIGPRRGQTGRRGTVLQLDKKTRLVIDPDRKESFKARVRKLQVGKDKKTTYYAVCCNELGHGALSNMKINERLARKTEAAADAGQPVPRRRAQS